MEEFMVQWEPEQSNLREALDQYGLGFNITSINSLDEAVSSQDLQPFVTVKRLTRGQRRNIRCSPLTTNCTVRFAPSPQGPTHIRFIEGGTLALETFLATEAQPSSAMPMLASTSARFTLSKQSSSAQAPTRVKIRAKTP